MIDVVVAVIRDAQGRVLLSQRQAHQDFAHHWEFPGGKVEANETLEDALVRELQEELAIVPQQWRKLIALPWDYTHRQVRLHAFLVNAWQGEPMACEGQTLAWSDLDEHVQRAMPAANVAIVNALNLPNYYAITGRFASLVQLRQGVEHALALGVGVIQLRASLAEDVYQQAVESILPLITQAGARLLLNSDLALWQQISAQFPIQAIGLHLSSERANHYQQRPVASDIVFSVSVHNQAQLQHAQQLNADCVLLSPILPTKTHPDMPALGWSQAAQWVAQTTIPVYALGGVGISDCEQAQAYGMQGVAGIGAFWPSMPVEVVGA